MYYNFLIHGIVVLFLCGVGILLDLSLKRKYSHYLFGVIFGLITIFVMDSRKIGMGIQDHYFDFRHITMTMAGFIGGPVTAVIAAIISSLYRYNVDVSGSMGGIANIVVFGSFGSILGTHIRSKQTGREVLFWFVIGFIMSVVLLLTIALIPPWESHTASVLRLASGPFLIITPLATTILFNFYYWAYEFFGKASILNTLINTSPINLMIFDRNGPILLSENMKMQHQFSPYIEDSTLLTDGDILGQNASAQQAREIATEDGRHFVAELSSFQMPSGKCACVAIVNDITDRKREQEALREAMEKSYNDVKEIKRILAEMEITREKLTTSQQEMATILESMADCYFAIDKEWKFTYINHAGETAFGKPRDELLGKKITEVYTVNDTARQYYQEAISQKIAINNFEIFSDALGNKWLEMSVYPTENGLTCYFRDITSRKISENEIARLDRLNLVGQLAAGIGHEIRNPMTTVRGYLQLLGAKSEYIAQKPTFDLMISELDRANSIISEFLSLARIKQTDLKSQNLKDILDDLYPLLEADTFNQNKQICFISDVIPDLELNKKEIFQMVLNLTRNGLEAMKERGCLTIKVYLEDGKVVLAIQDEGCGIPPEDLNKLGTPFFTTKDTGTGLGLATCFKIAESHNAKIHIKSSPNGTTFFISFPIPD